MKIKIENPCSEDWDKMTPTEKGKFCGACQKNVVDFSKMTHHEIYQKLNNHVGNICGRISKQQIIDFNATQELPSPSIIKKWSLAAALTGLLAYPNLTQGQDLSFQQPLAIVLAMNNIEDYEKKVESTNTPVEDTIVLEGKVINTKGVALYYSRVGVVGTNITTLTDKDGNFRVVVPKTKQEITLQAQYTIEYHTKTIKISADSTKSDLVIQLTINDKAIMMMGGMTMPEPRIKFQTKVKKAVNKAKGLLKPNKKSDS